MDAQTLAKKQLLWTKILAITVIVLLCLFLLVSLTLLQALGEARELAEQVRTMSARVEKLSAGLDAGELRDTMDALESTAKKLESVDWERLGANANGALEQAQICLRDLSAAMGKMDFDAMNKAVAQLQTVVEPLSRLASLFG